MSHITAEEWQLLSFFTVEPTLLDADVPWCYNHVVYNVRQGAIILRCALEPAFRDVHIVVEFETKRLYELDAKAVKDVRYTNAEGVELLEVVISEHESLLLHVLPRIALTHRYDGTP